MCKSLTLAVIVAVSLTACRTDSGANFILPTHDEILTLAYHPTQRVPEGFYVDERSNTDGSYSIYHIKDVSVSYELCTDNQEEAEALDSADNAKRAVNGILVERYENDRYFEFVRALTYSDGLGNISDPSSPGFSRVFKCTHVNRDGVDRTIRNGYAGTLNTRPLSREVLRTFVEYLWQFTYFWPAKKTVLRSYSEEFDDKFAHTLLIALVTKQGVEKCDIIEVVEWIFTVDKSSGEADKTYSRVMVFEAQQISGIPKKCNK